MSTYEVEIPRVGIVKVAKKKGMKSLRIRISPTGEVHVSAPWTIPKSTIDNFIHEREDWIIANAVEQRLALKDGMIVGNSTRLRISSGASRNHSTIRSGEILVKVAGRFDPANREQQNYIEKKVIEAMQNEAESILLPRLYELAELTGHDFNQAYVKRLTSRWGSCDQHKNITLNVFLVQLPPKLQDYVMLHELTHTKHMNHSPRFWDHMQDLMPSVKLYKKLLKNHRPRIEARI